MKTPVKALLTMKICIMSIAMENVNTSQSIAYHDNLYHVDCNGECVPCCVTLKQINVREIRMGRSQEWADQRHRQQWSRHNTES
jgi:hypothetical protein